MTVEFEQATPQRKRHKIMFWGPPGCFKTRMMLRLGGGLVQGDPVMAVIDTEFGTDHYAGEFNFRRKQTVEPKEILALVTQIAANPQNYRTIGLDTFSVYYEALVDEWVDKFFKREITSPGYKQEYYVLQPRDYQPINREAYRVVRKLLKCDLNVIGVFQTKEEWKNMRATGKMIPDGPRRASYFFDTLIEINEDKKEGFIATVLKDRSHVLRRGQILKWGTEEAAIEAMKGFDLLKGPKADGWVDPEEKDRVAETKALTQEVNTTPKLEPIEEKEPGPKSDPALAPELSEPDATLQDIVELKKVLRITDRVKWDALLKEYSVGTAKDLNQEQLNAFRAKLRAMVPSGAQAS